MGEYISESFDHTDLARLPEYRAALKALDDLVHRIGKELPDDHPLQKRDAWFKAVETMARTLPFSDSCTRCRDHGLSTDPQAWVDHPGDWRDHSGWPFRAEVKGGWMTGRYVCPAGHVWWCGYSTSAPDVAW